MIKHMSHSTEQASRLLEAERHVTVRMSEIVQGIPDIHPGFGDTSGLLDNTQALGQSIIAYLNSISEFQESVAAQLSFVLQGLKEADEEE